MKRPGGAWEDVSGQRVDPRRPYVTELPSGRSIALFFYDGPISRAVAFERLLDDGHRFAERLLGAFERGSDEPQVVHIATDGETYGHHHAYGEMALALALARFEHEPDVRLATYGQFLELHPPTWEVEIVERTSWSCVHGVERWRADCGCNSGTGWHQKWRAPLRTASTGCATRCALLRAGGGEAAGRPVGGARRLHRRRARAQRRSRRRVLRGARSAGAHPRAAPARALAPRAHPPRDADVHELRLVLRRASAASRRCRSCATRRARSSSRSSSSASSSSRRSASGSRPRRATAPSTVTGRASTSGWSGPRRSICAVWARASRS